MSNPPEGSVGHIDLDTLYRNVGEFVVLFQTLENRVWQLGVLALGLDDYDRSRRQLTDLSFHKLCERTSDAVFRRLDAVGRPAPEYRARIDAVLERCNTLRLYRNRMMHSTGLVFDQETITPGHQMAAIQELAQTAFELSLFHVQLIAWSSPSSSDAHRKGS